MKTELPVLPASPLPPLYAAWMDELLAGPIAAESDATCNDCAMLSPAAPHGSTEYFNPQTKCCAYVPTLPNFLVGRLLADKDQAAVQGRATIVARLQTGLNVTPLGMDASPVFNRLYSGNGHSLQLRCPHYLEEEGGRCGVWRNRNAVCSTWFCKHVRGATGMSFWQSLRDLLNTVESELARWCVLELELESGTLRQLIPPWGSARADQQLTAQQVDGRVDHEQQRAVWGEWFGREEEFFVECARLVNTLTWPEVLAACGPTVRAYARLTVEAYRKLNADELPARLKVGEFKTIQMNAESCRVVTYSGSDPIELSQRAMSILGYFDGRLTADALAVIATEKQLRLSEPLLRRLVDFKLLVPGEPEAGAIPCTDEARKPTNAKRSK